MTREALQIKLNGLLEQRKQLSAEIAGLYYQLRLLKKAGKDAPSRFTPEQLADLKKQGLID